MGFHTCTIEPGVVFILCKVTAQIYAAATQTSTYTYTLQLVSAAETQGEGYSSVSATPNNARIIPSHLFSKSTSDPPPCLTYTFSHLSCLFVVFPDVG